MKIKNKIGFALIELMISVAIIGILAAVALPQYQDFIRRSKMAEILAAASSCRTIISEQYLVAKKAPNAGNWGCEQAGGTAHVSKYVKSIETSINGAVRVRIQGDDLVKNQKLYIYLEPQVNSKKAMTAANDLGKSIYAWKCGAAIVEALKYLPRSCSSKFTSEPKGF